MKCPETFYFVYDDTISMVFGQERKKPKRSQRSRVKNKCLPDNNITVNYNTDSYLTQQRKIKPTHETEGMTGRKLKELSSSSGSGSTLLSDLNEVREHLG